MNAPAISRTLIDPLTLARRLNAGDAIVVLDCRFDLADPQAGRRAHAQGHIPGARYVHLDEDLSGVKTGTNGRHPLPAREECVARMQGWGLRPGVQVVAYDASGGVFAARLWWMCRWAGWCDVAVLDGGWAAWLEAGGPVSVEPAPPASGALAPWPVQGGARAMMQDEVVLDEVVRHVSAQGTVPGGACDFVLLDARSPARFRGEGETLDPVGGHIPGAFNRFCQLNLDEHGRFKPAAQLRAEFLALLGEVSASRSAPVPPTAVVHQCGSGVTACHNLLAMEVAGLSGSRLYAGSWSEWCADPARMRLGH
jgi:thiosulfate/3-mercaptopyruvate sulfurtransferase